MNDHILIVDDEPSIRNSLQSILEEEGYEVSTTDSAESTQALISEKLPSFDAALIDIWMPGMDGLTLLDWLREREENFPVIMMSGHGNIETAVRATKKGAYDFIEKPLALEKILLTLQHALKERALERENKELRNRTMLDGVEIIGNSKRIQEVLAELEQAAPTEGWVLIHGENGTGKELAAKHIHLHSKRNQMPFVAVNCAAIPEAMIESELFGYVKGAFVGASRTKPGKFSQANGGTLFLDEIGDMSLKTQAKILRVLQEQQFEQLGGTETHDLELRIIAATNKDLEKEIQAGRFREDLYYRLNVIPIELPPLRERKEDIALLVDYFLHQFSQSGGFPLKEVSNEAMASLNQYYWPGNIRELKNIVERMVIMVREREISLNHVPPVIRLSNAEVMQVGNLPNNLRQAMTVFEGLFLSESMKKNQWNLDQAAIFLEISRKELEEKIQQFEITVPLDI